MAKLTINVGISKFVFREDKNATPIIGVSVGNSEHNERMRSHCLRFIDDLVEDNLGDPIENDSFLIASCTGSNYGLVTYSYPFDDKAEKLAELLQKNADRLVAWLRKKFASFYKEFDPIELEVTVRR